MTNKEMIKFLEKVKKQVQIEKYDETIKLIDTKIKELKNSENPAEKYIDNIVSSLK